MNYTMNKMIERVGIAIAKASSDLHSTYGVFDYSSYGRTTKPHVVRDFTNKLNQNIGEFDTSEEADKFYINIRREYIAKAAIQAMRDFLADCQHGDMENAIDMLDEALK